MDHSYGDFTEPEIEEPEYKVFQPYKTPTIDQVRACCANIGWPIKEAGEPAHVFHTDISQITGKIFNVA